MLFFIVSDSVNHRTDMKTGRPASGKLRLRNPSVSVEQRTLGYA